MTQTPNYGLNIVEGNDIVNPLIQTNPNFVAIDLALKANADASIASALEVKTGINHAITYTGDAPVFRFVATSDYETGDTYSVNGDTVTVRCMDGSVPKNRAYVINQSVICILVGSLLTIVGASSTVNASEVYYDSNATVADVIADIYSTIGDLSDLDTTDKSNVVSAINEVYGDVHKGKVSIVADGIKTYREMLYDLITAADSTKITVHTKLHIGANVYHAGVVNVGDFRFGRVVPSANDIETDAGRAEADSVTNCFYARTKGTPNGTLTYENQSLIVPSAGTVFEMIY